MSGRKGARWGEGKLTGGGGGCGFRGQYSNSRLARSMSELFPVIVQILEFSVVFTKVFEPR